MSLPVILLPAAEADIRESSQTLNDQQAGLGVRYHARLREVLVRLEAMPQGYGVVWRKVRAAPLKKFRHIVYYVVRKDCVEVLAVRPCQSRHFRLAGKAVTP